MATREHITKALDHEGNYPFIVNGILILMAGLAAAPIFGPLGIHGALIAPKVAAGLVVGGSALSAAVALARKGGR